MGDITNQILNSGTQIVQRKIEYISNKTPKIIMAALKNNPKTLQYLTIDELNTLVATPCENDVLKRAALFSALTGLRHSDIQKLKWNEISLDNNQPRINFTQKKTKGVEYMPMSKQALQLCGEVGLPNDLIFKNLLLDMMAVEV